MAKKPVWRAQPFEDTARILRDQLSTDEVLLAEGRADEFDSDLFADHPPESGHDYVIVTPQRLIVAKRAYGSDRSRDFDLPWADVLSYAQETFDHQWLVLLRHPLMARWTHQRLRRFLWISWGGAWKENQASQTAIRFSRPDTKAAQAIRQQLVAKGVPNT